MLKRLEQKKVPIERINIKANKQQSIKNQLQNMCFKDPELKYLGQKAFISYVKSVYVQKDKDVFHLKELSLEDYAGSLGLPGAPRIKFIKGDDTKERKNASWKMSRMSSDEGESDAGDSKDKKQDDPQVRTRYDRMFERRNQDVLAEHYHKLINDDGTIVATGAGNGAGEDADEDADFLSVKRRFAAGDAGLDQVDSDSDAPVAEKDTKKVQIDGQEPLVIDSKRREKLLKSKKKLLKFKGKGTKLVYDEDGNAHEIYEMEDEDQFKARGDADTQREKFLAGETERTREADLQDKEVARDKRREKKEKRKARDRALADEEADEERGLQHLPYIEPDLGTPPPSEPESDSEPEAETRRPSKKARVSFVEPDDSEEESSYKRDKSKKSKKNKTAEPQIETLGDLEALASGLLG